MSSKTIEDAYPLSPMQQGMLFHTLYEPEASVYVNQLTATIHGRLDFDAFKRAWQDIVESYSILRTAFVWEKLAQPLQIVGRLATLPIEVEDWRDYTPAEQQARLERHLAADRARGFKLSKAPLARIAVFQMDDTHYTILWSQHHIVLDGWSNSHLFKDFFTLYEAYIRGASVRLPPTRPYRDYISWLQAQDHTQAEGFWRQFLANVTAPTPLGVDLPNPEALQGQAQYAELSLILPDSLTSAMRAFVRRHHLTLNTLFLGVWALLLSRYSNEDDVVFGVTGSGRPETLDGVEAMVGLFINTLPFRARVPYSTPAVQWLTTLQTCYSELREHEYCSLVDIHGWSDVTRDRPLFDSLMIFENYPVDEALRKTSGSLKIEHIQVQEQTNYPLTLVVAPGQGISLLLSYQCARFTSDTILRMQGHMLRLLEGLIETPDIPIRDLPLLTPAEYQAAIGPAAPSPFPPPSACLHHAFLQQADRTPDAIALSFQGASCSYRTLATRATRLAHLLLRRGLRPGQLVALCFEPDPDLVVALLAVLLAGGAYLPLDPAAPAERLATFLDDAQPHLLLSTSALRDRLPSQTPPRLLLDADADAIAACPASLPAVPLTPDFPAYLIYTSGSTGQPKGTLVSHAQALRLFSATQPWFGFDQHDVWTLFHSYAFDFSVWELWGALLYGGRLVLVPYWCSRDPEAFAQLLVQEGVTVLNQTPSAFRLLLDAQQRLGAATQLQRLRYVIFGGEALDLQSLRPWFERYGDQRPQLVNMYGITETTVHVTYRPLRASDLDGVGRSVIGEPIPDLRLYLLDGQGRPVPVGVVGEIVVGGAGVALGYWARPGQTAERFVPDPYSGVAGARLYRSGDLARRLPDGELEYLGRGDQQVKLRGFRIELGEIEAALYRHASVQAAAVLLQEQPGQEKQLVAYVVADGAPQRPAELRTFLLEQLPSYVVPAHIHMLDTLPLTRNGKLDRAALPAPAPLPIEQLEAEPAAG